MVAVYAVALLVMLAGLSSASAAAFVFGAIAGAMAALVGAWCALTPTARLMLRASYRARLHR